MNFIETSLKGLYVVDIQPIADTRVFFSRTFCAKEYAEHGLEFNLVQSNISHTLKKDTIRGLHYQEGESAEIKIFRCIQGSILDVIVDIREESETFGQHYTIELNSEDAKAVYIPKGLAHGYLTLQDDCRVLYMVSEYYNKDSGRAIRWNDPYFNINWPISNPILSDQDKSVPDYKPNKK